MTTRKDESMHFKNEYSNKLDKMLSCGNLEEAFALAITHGIMQNRKLMRLDFNQKLTLIDQLAKKTQDLANTYSGFGFNTSTALVFAKTASGMFGLVGFAERPFGFDLSKIELDKRLQMTQNIAGVVSGGFATIKELKDEGTQGNRILKQHDVDETKRRQDEKRTNAQQLQSSTAELINQLKQLNQIIHEKKSLMTRSGG